MKKKATMRARVEEVSENTVYLEFGSTQAQMDFSANGLVQRSLRLKDGDKVNVTIEVTKRSK